MKRSLLILIAAFLFFPLFAQYEVRGGSGRPLSVGTSQLTEIYLLNGLDGAQIKFTSTQSGTHQWYRYSQSIDDAVPIPSTQSGNSSVITDIQEGYGYYVEAPIGTGYVWIIDYSHYVARLSGLRVEEDEYSCDQLRLVADANVTPIYYYTSKGSKNNLQREFRLIYNTLQWQGNDKVFTPFQVDTILTENAVFPEITLSEPPAGPPLTNTTFTLTDVFADYFGIAQAITSEEYRAIRVEVHFSYDKDREFGSNEKLKGDTLSAPLTYTFTAYANEPVAAFYMWKVLKQDPLTGQFNQIAQYPERVLQYPFENQGTYWVKLEVNNNDAQSVCTGTDSIKIVIGNTDLFIPNAFSPGSSIGVNDILKVSFRSITAFRASIYNRWGNLLYQWTDPTKGWDGRVNGKFVPTGAYFIVVEYTDSEGKRRSKGQDVNILRGKDLPPTP